MGVMGESVEQALEVGVMRKLPRRLHDSLGTGEENLSLEAKCGDYPTESHA